MAKAMGLAARLLKPRLLHHRNSNSLFKESAFEALPFSDIIVGRYVNLRRGIQTQSETSIEVSGSKVEAGLGSQTDVQNVVKHTSMSNLKVSARHDLAMIFTCKVCDTRSMKTCCRESYENGVVVVRCGGCNNLHLIADRLGWFGEPGSIEDLLAARGEEVKKGSVDSINLTLEDLAGKNHG